MLSIQLRAIMRPDNGLSHAQKSILVAILSSGIETGKCYASHNTIAQIAGYKRRRTVDVLSELTRAGLVCCSPAADDPHVPRKNGWVYTLNLDAILALGAAQQLHSSETNDCAAVAHHTVQRLHSAENTPAQSNQPQAIKKQEEIAQCNPCTAQPLHPSILTTYSDSEIDRSVGGDPSRVRVDARETAPLARTHSAPTKIHPGKEAAAKRAAKRSPVAVADPASTEEGRAVARAAEQVPREALRAVQDALVAALPTLDLKDVRGLWRRCAEIVVARGGVEQAVEYVQLRGIEWTGRLEAGEVYTPHAVVGLVTADAPSWVAKARPVKASREEETRPWTLEARAAAAEEAQAVLAAQASQAAPSAAALPEIPAQVRRTPRPSDAPPVPATLPAWWRVALERLHSHPWCEQQGKVTRKVAQDMLLCAMLLHRAEVVMGPGGVRVRGGSLAADGVADLAEHAEIWTRLIVQAAAEQGVPVRVTWAEGEEEPAAAPVRVAPPSPRPTWWAGIGVTLRTWAGKALHLDGAQEVALVLSALERACAGAQRAWLDEATHELVVELDRLEPMLAANRAWALDKLAHAVQLQLDAPSRPTVCVVELDEQGEVRP